MRYFGNVSSFHNFIVSENIGKMIVLNYILFSIRKMDSDFWFIFLSMS